MSISKIAVSNLSVTDSQFTGLSNTTVIQAPNINGEIKLNGEIKINGRNLEERLSTIEQVLNIPTRDATMEKKYPKLKKNI